MKTGTFARIGAAGFVVTALALSVLQLGEPAAPTTETILVPQDAIDPLRVELRRCRSIGQAAASDRLCLRAWAEQRSRFFMAVHDANGAAFDEAAPAANADLGGGAAVNSDTATPSPAAPPSTTQDGSH